MVEYGGRQAGRQAGQDEAGGERPRSGVIGCERGAGRGPCIVAAREGTVVVLCR